MTKIKIKYLLYIYLIGMVFTIFFKYKTISIHDYKFILNTTGVMLKNIAIISFVYKAFINDNTRNAWNKFIES